MPLGPPIVIANVFRVAFEWSNPTNGQKAANVMCFAKPGGTSAALATALNAHATSSMWRTVNIGFSIGLLNILPLDGISPTTPFAVTGAQWKTNYASDNGYETQNACLVSLRSAVRGPKARGRVYLPFVDEVWSNAGSLDNTVIAAMQTAWNTFMTDMATALYPIVIASRKHLDYNVATGLVVEGLAGTQRRRQQRLRRS